MDTVNGLFECCASLFICLSIWRLYKDKKVNGISIIHVSFFCAWGWWNLFYYPHLEQMWSTIGAACVVLTNTIWMIQLLYYHNRTKKNEC